MLTPVNLAQLVAVQLASRLFPTCRHASHNARSHYKPGILSTGKLDISEEDLDMDEVEAELKSIVK